MADAQPEEWHREVISETAANTLGAIRGLELLSSFYLAGGTGLALLFGHRRSEDLDFFSRELFNEELLLQQIQRVKGFALVAKQAHTLHATIDATKVTFLGYAYPVLFPLAYFADVAVADPQDIACMKISAIASRGTKRNFVDLYVAAQRFGLPHLLQLFDRKYAQARYNKLHVLKSLVFFDDAEKDPMPHMLAALDWPDVKEFFLGEASRWKNEVNEI